MELTEIITAEDLKEPYNIMVSFLTMEEILRIAQTYAGRQVKFRRGYQDIRKDYPELTALLGAEKAKIFIRMLGGNIGVYFPELKRNCTDKIKRMIMAEYNGYNHLALAKKYGYTERHIRRIMEAKNKRRSFIDENQISLFELEKD